MPWRSEAMKDVDSCDMLRLGAKQPLTRRFPNGETQLGLKPSYPFTRGQTRGTETSKYPEEEKSKEILKVAVSEIRSA